MAAFGQPAAEFITQSSLFYERIRSIYEPLDSDRMQIRLMHLLPGKLEEDGIEVNLSIVNLEDDPVYDALSYTWDSLTPTETIILCGIPYQVTTNQYSALRRLRLLKGERKMWMDVTCINQTDVVERGHQVSIMGQIYAHAAQTRVWLGEPQPSWAEITDYDWNAHVLRLNSMPEQIAYMTRCAKESPAGAMPTFIRTVTEEPDGILKGALHILKLLADRVHVRYMPYCELDVDGKLQHCRPFYHVLEMILSLLQRPWWTRVWVLQEACLSQTIPVVHVGSQQVLIRTLTDARNGWMDSWKHWQRDDHLLGEIYDLQAFIAGMARLTTYGNALETIGHKFGRLILPIGLTLVNERNAGDKRDFVYGIMAVIQEESRIPIDYSLNSAQVYSLATWHACTGYAAGFNLLKEAAGLNAIDIPSWTIDWGRRDETHFADSDLFEAREDTDEDLTQCFYIDGVLQLTANKIDIIKFVLETSEDPNLPVSSQALDIILGWTRQLHTKGLVPNPELQTSNTDDAKMFFTTILRETKTDEHGNMVRFISDNDRKEILDWFDQLRRAAESGDADLAYQASEHQLSLDLQHAIRGSSLCVTEQGRLCLVKTSVQAEDVLYHIRGCSVPLALRAADPINLKWTEEDDGPLVKRMIDPFRMVGPCYLTDAMGLDGANRAAEEVLYLV